jgi:hypothetical protein
VNYVYAVVEGITDVPIAKKIIAEAGRSVADVYELGGKARVNAKIPDFNRVARYQSWLVLRDLDRDDVNACICELRLQLLRKNACTPGLALRFAIRASESWLLSDADGIVDFFDVPSARVPARADRLMAPKGALVALCKYSKRRDIRDGMLPTKRSTARVGPRYTSLIRRFAEERWDIAAAMKVSGTLATTIARVADLP